MAKIKPLKPDETLDWHDLFRRIRAAFPDFFAMYAAYREWSEQRNRIFSMYHNIDVNAAGRMTQQGAMASAKDAHRRWKRKH